MCWGFTCGDGWFDLIDELSAKLEAEIVRMKEAGVEGDELPVAARVKEKFSMLRVDVESATEEMCTWIHEAEDRSRTICEDCGKPGKKRDDQYWLRTLCDSCSEERNRAWADDLTKRVEALGLAVVWTSDGEWCWCVTDSDQQVGQGKTLNELNYFLFDWKKLQNEEADA